MMNPNAQFVCVSLTRAQIADLMNDVINSEAYGISLPLFSPSDDRLTTDVCQEVADEWADVLQSGLSEEDLGAAQRDAISEVLTKYFPS